jgi:hypothetical protein
VCEELLEGERAERLRTAAEREAHRAAVAEHSTAG